MQSPKKGKNPPLKKSRRDGNEDVTTSDYDGDSSPSTIILEHSLSGSVEQQDSSNECKYCTMHTLYASVSFEDKENFSKHSTN